MKKILFITLTIFVLLTIIGCSEKTYLFKETVDEIENIEIVSAEDSLTFEVIKILSDTEKNDFLAQFQSIQFQDYYVGDPMEVSGDAVKITYQNGDYEMICSYWAEYVKNGEVYPVRRSCNENEFNKLLNNFIEDGSR